MFETCDFVGNSVTVVNGGDVNIFGAGALVTGLGNPTFTSCVFDGNSLSARSGGAITNAFAYGGAICAQAGSITSLNSCWISQNSVDSQVTGVTTQALARSRGCRWSDLDPGDVQLRHQGEPRKEARGRRDAQPVHGHPRRRSLLGGTAVLAGGFYDVLLLLR